MSSHHPLGASAAPAIVVLRPPHARRTRRSRPIEPVEREIIDSCVDGDPLAWGRLVDRYAGLVYSIPRRLNLRDDECDDVAQTVFVILLRRLGSLRDVESLPKWLMTTTRRECLRVIRRRQALSEHADRDPDVGDPPADRLETLERAAALHSALASIGDRCERLLTMLFMTDPPPDYAAISNALSIPVGSIGPTRARCLAKLHAALAADPAGRAALDALDASNNDL